jgi:catechol 2,3-dioxygenase
MEKFHQKPITFVGEVSINVLDLNKAILFYQEIIGLQVLKSSLRMSFRKKGGRRAYITLPCCCQPVPTYRFFYAIYFKRNIHLEQRIMK